MITNRIVENKKRQNASSIHSSLQSYRHRGVSFKSIQKSFMRGSKRLRLNRKHSKGQISLILKYHMHSKEIYISLWNKVSTDDIQEENDVAFVPTPILVLTDSQAENLKVFVVQMIKITDAEMEIKKQQLMNRFERQFLANMTEKCWSRYLWQQR